ncbi:hypothetical protein P7H19_23475 [Paenibacillus larvae]|nr:hypothetical protein [Paenibacillus larvae]MDT2238660.1 hypothetical protein [Paenibacillus larvae]
MGIGPVPATRKVLKMSGLSIGEIDLFEINEAFAAQVIASVRELNIDPDRVNVNGGYRTWPSAWMQRCEDTDDLAP